MKTFLLGMAAIAALTLATPAFAHDRDDGWNVDSYSELTQLDRHIRDGIQHGLRDGSFTRDEANDFYRELREIRALAAEEERDGDFDLEEINDRLNDLHDRMHRAHDEGHEQMDDDWNRPYSRW